MTDPIAPATVVMSQAKNADAPDSPGSIAAMKRAAMVLSPSDFLSITTRRLRM